MYSVIRNTLLNSQYTPQSNSMYIHLHILTYISLCTLLILSKKSRSVIPAIIISAFLQNRTQRQYYPASRYLAARVLNDTERSIMDEITLYTLHSGFRLNSKQGRRNLWEKINTQTSPLLSTPSTLWINSKCIYREIIAGVRLPNLDLRWLFSIKLEVARSVFKPHNNTPISLEPFILKRAFTAGNRCSV